jgi:hypothetical protein
MHEVPRAAARFTSWPPIPQESARALARLDVLGCVPAHADLAAAVDQEPELTRPPPHALATRASLADWLGEAGQPAQAADQLAYRQERQDSGG